MQKETKQGRGDGIKLFSIQPHASSELKQKISIGWSVCPDIFNFARTLIELFWLDKDFLLKSL